MKILVGCEYSGIVSEAFALLGHSVVSCDLEAGDNIIRRTHLIGDVFDIARSRSWDMAIFHPPCTYLCRASQGLINQPGRKELMLIAVDFVRRLSSLPIPKIAIENPIGKLSSLWRPPNQIVYPWYFGDNYSKDICWWLKGLPSLSYDRGTPKPDRLRPVSNHTNGRMSQALKSKIKSKFFPGIAKAMAEQWGRIASEIYP